MNTFCFILELQEITISQSINVDFKIKIWL